jgi:F420H(2)-dependent quinone reductase
VPVWPVGSLGRHTANRLTGGERDEFYAKQVAAEPQFGDYQRNTSRIIPVVELQRS